MTTPASFSSFKMTQELSNIEHPHEHDVLSGRGNFVNYHEGNEYYRILVRKYKLEYVRCPKPQKGNFSRTIVDAIKARNPPGRFLKQDATTKLWYDIGDKKALDKTRQALREGAPEIVKETTSDSSGESDDGKGHRAVKTDGFSIRSSGLVGKASANHFMTSPNPSRNGVLSDPGLLSPAGLVSPRMMMASMSPAMAQFSGTPANGGYNNGMMDASALPCPPLQTHHYFETLNQLKAQQQASLMMNVQMNNNFQNTLDFTGMPSQEQMVMQSHLQQQQMQLNLLQQLQQQQQQLQQQQLQQQEVHMNNVQAKLTSGEMTMMNMTNMTMHNHGVTPNPNLPLSGENPHHSLATNQFAAQSISEILPPQAVQSSILRNVQQSSSHQVVVQTMPGNNPRRMPPPSLLKREDSMKMERIFVSSPSPSVKSKVEGSGGLSNHLSAMSLSIADMQDDGNLSSVFDSSLRISNSNNLLSKQRIREKTSSDANPFEMSVNTLGTHALGDMSYATFTEGNESDGAMSFGKVFEDTKD